MADSCHIESHLVPTTRFWSEVFAHNLANDGPKTPICLKYLLGTNSYSLLAMHKYEFYDGTKMFERRVLFTFLVNFGS